MSNRKGHQKRDITHESIKEEQVKTGLLLVELSKKFAHLSNLLQQTKQTTRPIPNDINGFQSPQAPHVTISASTVTPSSGGGLSEKRKLYIPPQLSQGQKHSYSSRYTGSSPLASSQSNYNHEHHTKKTSRRKHIDEGKKPKKKKRKAMEL